MSQELDQDPFTRLFTLAEAHTLLAEIAPLVGEMKTAFKKIRREIADASRASGLDPGNPALSDALDQRGIAPPLVAQVNELIRRIHETGCVVNGPEAGLVDFPALLGSEIVYLCWQHGEAEIRHYHRIPDGFSGRRPLLETRRADATGSSIH